VDFLSFAPVVDLRPDHAPLWDRNSRIGERAIAAESDRVIAAAEGYVHGLASQAVHATLKHFPGLVPRAATPTMSRPVSTSPATRWKGATGAPFVPCWAPPLRC